MAGNVVRAWRSGLSVRLTLLTCKFDPFHSQTLLLCPLITLPARKPHSNQYYQITWQHAEARWSPVASAASLGIDWSEIWGEGGMGGEM